MNIGKLITSYFGGARYVPCGDTAVRVFASACGWFFEFAAGDSRPAARSPVAALLS